MSDRNGRRVPMTISRGDGFKENRGRCLFNGHLKSQVDVLTTYLSDIATTGLGETAPENDLRTVA